MNSFFNTLIQERIHNNAKLSAEEENWQFQTQFQTPFLIKTFYIDQEHMIRATTLETINFDFNDLPM